MLSPRNEIKIQDLKNQINPSQSITQKSKEPQECKFMKQTFNQLHNQAKQQNLRTEKADKKEKEEVEADKKRSPSIPRNRRFGLGYGDRKKSVSKSIQRQHSMSSLVDYTLKFLNDDMAINASKFI